jgi:hypothetical protein
MRLSLSGVHGLPRTGVPSNPIGAPSEPYPLKKKRGRPRRRTASAGLREALASEPRTPLRHYCSPYHTNSALYPVIGLLERAAGLQRGDPPESQLDKLETMLALAVENVQESAPLLADLLAIPTGGRYPTPAAQEGKGIPSTPRSAGGLGIAPTSAGTLRGRALD